MLNKESDGISECEKSAFSFFNAGSLSNKTENKESVNLGDENQETTDVLSCVQREIIPPLETWFQAHQRNSFEAIKQLKTQFTYSGGKDAKTFLAWRNQIEAFFEEEKVPKVHWIPITLKLLQGEAYELIARYPRATGKRLRDWESMIKVFEIVTRVEKYNLEMKPKAYNFKPKGSADQVVMEYTKVIIPTTQKESEHYGWVFLSRFPQEFQNRVLARTDNSTQMAEILDAFKKELQGYVTCDEKTGKVIIISSEPRSKTFNNNNNNNNSYSYRNNNYNNNNYKRNNYRRNPPPPRYNNYNSNSYSNRENNNNNSQAAVKNESNNAKKLKNKKNVKKRSMPIHMTEEVTCMQGEEREEREEGEEEEDEEIMQQTIKKKDKRKEQDPLLHTMWMIEEKPFDRKTYEREIRRLRGIINRYARDEEKRLHAIIDEEDTSAPIINSMTFEETGIKDPEVVPEIDDNYNWLLEDEHSEEEVGEEGEEGINDRDYPTRWGSDEEQEEESIEEREPVEEEIVDKKSQADQHLQILLCNINEISMLYVYLNIGNVNNSLAHTLIDCGASLNLINSNYIKKNSIVTKFLEHPKLVQYGDGRQRALYNHVEQKCYVYNQKGQKYEFKLDFVVADLPAHIDAVLSIQFIRKHVAFLDFRKNRIHFINNVVVNILGSSDQIKRKVACNGSKYNAERAAVFLQLEKKEVEIIEDANVLKLIQKYKDVFPEELPDGLPPESDGMVHRIELTDPQPPPVRSLYRLSETQLAELKEQLTELLRKKFIRPSTSPYAANILFVPKKTGE